MLLLTSFRLHIYLTLCSIGSHVFAAQTARYPGPGTVSDLNNATSSDFTLGDPVGLGSFPLIVRAGNLLLSACQPPALFTRIDIGLHQDFNLEMFSIGLTYQLPTGTPRMSNLLGLVDLARYKFPQWHWTELADASSITGLRPFVLDDLLTKMSLSDAFALAADKVWRGYFYSCTVSQREGDANPMYRFQRRTREIHQTVTVDVVTKAVSFYSRRLKETFLEDVTNESAATA